MELETIKPTYKIAFKIWWAMAWRKTLLLAISIGIVFVLHLPSDLIKLKGALGSIVSGITFLMSMFLLIVIVNIYPVYLVINKKFKKFSLVVINNVLKNPVAEPHTPLDPTYKIVLKVWFYFFSNDIFIQILLFGFLGIIYKIMMFFFQDNSYIMSVPVFCGGLLAYLSSSIFAMHMVLSRKFTGFSLAIVKNTFDKADKTETSK